MYICPERPRKQNVKCLNIKMQSLKSQGLPCLMLAMYIHACMHTPQ